jgi:hypothetical protein
VAIYASWCRCWKLHDETICCELNVAGAKKDNEAFAINLCQTAQSSLCCFLFAGTYSKSLHHNVMPRYFSNFTSRATICIVHRVQDQVPKPLPTFGLQFMRAYSVSSLAWAMGPSLEPAVDRPWLRRHPRPSGVRSSEGQPMWDFALGVRLFQTLPGQSIQQGGRRSVLD